ncbi:MAG TPA: sn-glycerol-3-phosphate ABC transporter ATP-binding protein UgpC [Thermohalobaculum sp.]|nr:sn-glycerol-3-phosphate ABC transporter ATP-binding protein UgpC [Thermohalobaculum sp.]
MTEVVLDALTKRFGRTDVIRGVDLSIRSGEFFVLVGPSGCGKSTLLRMIAGLEEIDGGTLSIGGARVNDLAPKNRGVAMVFQSYALYPHMTVHENMAFGLRLARTSSETVEARVRRAAEMLELGPLLDRRPADLSGGQRQRVAIGRAIVREPRLFLFDEPLSNLDASLRVQTRVEIAKLHRALGATMIYVTHDQTEAMTLADRIAVMREGQVAQVGRPLELYHRPADRFVAGFLGSPAMNFLSVRAAGARGGALRCRLADGTEVATPARADGVAEGAALTLGIRPEHVRTGGDGPAFEVDLVEELGEAHLLHLSGPTGERLVVRRPGGAETRAGARLALAFPAETCHVFGEDGAALARLPEAERARGDAP